MELEAFLEQQRELGVEDSEGHFTMAVDNAAWKLSEFLLTEKEPYPLYLLSCAVCGGASSFKVVRHAGARRDIFVFDGQAITLDELQKLALPLGGPEASTRIRDLGTVLNVSASLGEVTLRSNQGDACVQLTIGAMNQTARHGLCPASC